MAGSSGAVIYLTNAVSIPAQYRGHFGFLASAVHNRNTKDELEQGSKWLLDNDAFNGNFDLRRWLRFLLEHEQFKPTCIGVTIPDVVGDALGTLRNFSHYYKVVADLGYPVAFVSQDGITPEITPWEHFSTLFIGGTNGHKLGPEACYMISEAKRLGKWVHVGRVNSESRLKNFWMVDSVDGTQLTVIGKGPNGQSREERQAQDMQRLAMAVEYCRNKKSGNLGVNHQYKFPEEESA